MAAIPAYFNHCTLRCCHIGTHLFLNRINIAVTLCCILSNSETSSTGRIRFHSDAGRIRTCTSFLMDDLANRSANHYGTAPLRIQVVLSHHLARTGFLRVLSIELLYLSHHSRDSNPGTLYGQSIFKIAFSSFRTYGIVNCSIFPNS